jgi:hypothetical protein
MAIVYLKGKMDKTFMVFNLDPTKTMQEFSCTCPIRRIITMGGNGDIFICTLKNASQTPSNHANKSDPKLLQELKPTTSPIHFVPNASKVYNHARIFCLFSSFEMQVFFMLRK